MSLVSDALRRARQEAATREAVERGGPPAARVLPPRPRRIGAVVLAALVGVAALGGAAVAWWLLEGTGMRGAATEAAEVPPPTAAAHQPSPVTAAEPQHPGETEVAAKTAALPAAAPAAAAPVPAAVTAQPAEQAESPPAEPAAPGPEPKAAEPQSSASAKPPTASPHAEGPRDFVEHADLGYAKLELGYIAYLPSDPFAQVNGRDVHVGAVVDGFVVKKITANAVTLEDEHGTVILRVR